MISSDTSIPSLLRHTTTDPIAPIMEHQHHHFSSRYPFVVVVVLGHDGGDGGRRRHRVSKQKEFESQFRCVPSAFVNNLSFGKINLGRVLNFHCEQMRTTAPPSSILLTNQTRYFWTIFWRPAGPGMNVRILQVCRLPW